MDHLFVGLAIFSFMTLCFSFPFEDVNDSSLRSIVSTSHGPVKGKFLYTSLGTQYAAFRGIPYAAPPTGTRRLLPPSPPQPWEEVLDVSEDSGITCPQVADVAGQEDCLYLFVYSPNVQQTASNSSGLPVMVWVHGGGFLVGGGTYGLFGPNRIMDHGVVVVSVNYRLGSLGFFSLGTEEVNGNQAMLDQLMALHWVQENIRGFGGDPGQVTLWGESAGSFSSFYHLMSPLSEGLFHRIIGQSGHPLSAVYHEYTAEQAERKGLETATNLGCVIEGHDTLKCLQEAPLASIMLSTHAQPAVDAPYTSTPFLPMSSHEAYTTGNYNKDVDIMLGVNKDEGVLLIFPAHIAPSIVEQWKNTWNTTGPIFLFGHLPGQTTDEDIVRLGKITDFYLGSSNNLDYEHIQELTDMMTDSWMLSGVHQFVSEHMKGGGQSSLYQYLYSHQGEHSFTNTIMHAGGPYGVTHTDECFLLFDPINNSPVPLNYEDYQVSETLLKLWTNFAKYGNPTSSSSGLPFTWSPIDQDYREYLNISSMPEMEYSQEYQSRMDFWDSLIIY